MQYGFFDWQNRFEKFDTTKDPLWKLKSALNWELFRAKLEAIRDKQRKSAAGAKPYDAVLMFKILILQSLYNLSDEAVEYQILDRMSFMRFLGLQAGDPVPDAKTIWLFREQLKAPAVWSICSRSSRSFLQTTAMLLNGGKLLMPVS